MPLGSFCHGGAVACYHLCRVNMSCYSWFMFRGKIISFVLIQNLTCYSGDPKHVYYNENMDYFHNKELHDFPITARIWYMCRTIIWMFLSSESCFPTCYCWMRGRSSWSNFRLHWPWPDMVGTRHSMHGMRSLVVNRWGVRRRWGGFGFLIVS